MTTDRRLVCAAAALLDEGGDTAVSLRAVATAVGLSHNAPYKHFASRDALLAAVATDDFGTLSEIFTAGLDSDRPPADQLREALDGVAEFFQRHPARYRLLLSDPVVAAQEGDLRTAAEKAFRSFAALVKNCQDEGALPDAPTGPLSSLIFATLHGLIDAQASGRLGGDKGFGNVKASMDLYLDLLLTRR